MTRPAAITIDAAGTLLHPAEPVPEVYARIAARHGGVRSASEISPSLRAAVKRARSLRHGEPTWRAYWSAVVHETTGIAAPELVDELVAHYVGAQAWHVAHHARTVLARLRDAGVRLGVLSNWDTGLVRVLDGLELTRVFDAIVVSGACGFEKPNPRIFEEAARRLGVGIGELVHVGDDPHDDHDGATQAGAVAWDIVAVGGFPGLLAKAGLDALRDA